MATVSGSIMVPKARSASFSYRAGGPYGTPISGYNSTLMRAIWDKYGQNQLVVGEAGVRCFARWLKTDVPLPIAHTSEARMRIPFPNKDFVKRQRAGEIVVAPFENRSIQVQYKPGWMNATETGIGPGHGWFTLQDYGFPDVIGDCYPENPWKAKKKIGVYVEYTTVNGTIDNLELPGDLELSALYPTEEIDTSIVTAALAEANSGTYDLLTEVAELPETLKYLIGLLRDFASALKAVRKKEVEVRKMFRNKKQTSKTAYEMADALASVWLQFRYAISPLNYSIQDIILTLEEYKRVFAKYRQKTSDYAEPKSISGLDILAHDDFTQTHKVFIKRSFSPEDIVDALLSLLKVNPLATAYELIPLSFVMDWFVNIGDYITAMTNSVSYSQQAATYSWKTEGNVTYGKSNLILPDGFNAPEVNLSYSGYKRIVIDPKAHTGLSYDPFINWKRQLDALALLWGPTKKILKGL